MPVCLLQHHLAFFTLPFAATLCVCAACKPSFRAAADAVRLVEVYAIASLALQDTVVVAVAAPA
jgi:hypothetical protein